MGPSRKKLALIFSGGTYRNLEFYRGFVKDADLIVAADSGGDALFSLNVTPHLLVGDMDSIGAKVFEAIKERGVEVIQVVPEKDFTDTELAVRVAMDREATEIIIFGALGQRLDHTLANLSLLSYALKRGVFARIVTEDQEVYLLNPRVRNPIGGEVGDTVSLISLADPSTGVTTHDLKYPLKEASLWLLSPLSVSNEISGSHPWVELREGRLLLIKVRNP